MQHFVISILVIICSTMLYIFSWKNARHDRYNLALWLIAIAGIVIRLWIASDPFIHEWDERYHALVAKHLSQHLLKPTLYENPILPFDYTNWQANHIWLHKQPMTLWLIAISIKLLGACEIAVRLPSILMSTIAIKLVFDIGKYLYSAFSGFIAALLFSFNGFIIALAAGRIHTDHTDITFLFFITLSVWFCIRYVRDGKIYNNIFTGLFLGCAVLTKWLTAYIVLPIWLLLVLYKRKDSLVKAFSQITMIVTVSLAIFLPWQLYILDAFPKEAALEYSYNNIHLFKAVEGHEGNALFHINWLGTIYGFLVYFSIVWFIFRTIKERNIGDITVAIWFIVPYIFFMIVATKMPAYPLIAGPAIFIMMAESIIYLLAKAKEVPRYKPVMLLLAYGVIIFSSKYTLERIKPIIVEQREPAWTKATKALKNTPVDFEKYIIFNDGHYVETMFYLNCTSYPFIPDSATIKRLEASGYNILINKIPY